jgi:hypothetical protein
MNTFYQVCEFDTSYGAVRALSLSLSLPRTQ